MEVLGNPFRKIFLAQVGFPRPDSVRELATHTETQTLHLAGQRCLFLVHLDSEGEAFPGFITRESTTILK